MSMTSLLLHLILLLTQLQLTNAAWTLFAVTNSTHCAKSLPTGYKKINIGNWVGGNGPAPSAYVSLAHREFMHKSFLQKFYVGGVLKFQATWTFPEYKKLQQRFNRAKNYGEFVEYEIIDFTATDGVPKRHVGVNSAKWHFSAQAGDPMGKLYATAAPDLFSSMGGTWGLASGTIDSSDTSTCGSAKTIWWGHENCKAAKDDGSCDKYQHSNSHNPNAAPKRSTDIVNLMYAGSPDYNYGRETTGFTWPSGPIDGTRMSGCAVPGDFSLNDDGVNFGSFDVETRQSSGSRNNDYELTFVNPAPGLVAYDSTKTDSDYPTAEKYDLFLTIPDTWPNVDSNTKFSFSHPVALFDNEHSEPLVARGATQTHWGLDNSRKGSDDVDFSTGTNTLVIRGIQPFVDSTKAGTMGAFRLVVTGADHPVLTGDSGTFRLVVTKASDPSKLFEVFNGPMHVWFGSRSVASFVDNKFTELESSKAWTKMFYQEAPERNDILESDMSWLVASNSDLLTKDTTKLYSALNTLDTALHQGFSTVGGPDPLMEFAMTWSGSWATKNPVNNFNIWRQVGNPRIAAEAYGNYVGVVENFVGNGWSGLEDSTNDGKTGSGFTSYIDGTKIAKTSDEDGFFSIGQRIPYGCGIQGPYTGSPGAKSVSLWVRRVHIRLGPLDTSAPQSSVAYIGKTQGRIEFRMVVKSDVTATDIDSIVVTMPTSFSTACTSASPCKGEYGQGASMSQDSEVIQDGNQKATIDVTTDFNFGSSRLIKFALTDVTIPTTAQKSTTFTIDLLTTGSITAKDSVAEDLQLYVPGTTKITSIWVSDRGIAATDVEYVFNVQSSAALPNSNGNIATNSHILIEFPSEYTTLPELTWSIVGNGAKVSTATLKIKPSSIGGNPSVLLGGFTNVGVTSFEFAIKISGITNPSAIGETGEFFISVVSGSTFWLPREAADGNSLLFAAESSTLGTMTTVGCSKPVFTGQNGIVGDIANFKHSKDLTISAWFYVAVAASDLTIAPIGEFCDSSVTGAKGCIALGWDQTQHRFVVFYAGTRYESMVVLYSYEGLQNQCVATTAQAVVATQAAMTACRNRAACQKFTWGRFNSDDGVTYQDTDEECTDTANQAMKWDLRKVSLVKKFGWRHVTVVYAATEKILRMYVDGVIIGCRKSGTTTFSSTGCVNVAHSGLWKFDQNDAGRHTRSATRYMVGSVEDLYIWSRALDLDANRGDEYGDAIRLGLVLRQSYTNLGTDLLGSYGSTYTVGTNVQYRFDTDPSIEATNANIVLNFQSTANTYAKYFSATSATGVSLTSVFYDGDVTTCAETDDSVTGSHYIEFKLEKATLIDRVTIFGVAGNVMSSGFTVHVSDTAQESAASQFVYTTSPRCSSGPLHSASATRADPVASVPCNLHGQYIVVASTTSQLNICEIEIYSAESVSHLSMLHAQVIDSAAGGTTYNEASSHALTLDTILSSPYRNSLAATDSDRTYDMIIRYPGLQGFNNYNSWVQTSIPNTDATIVGYSSQIAGFSRGGGGVWAGLGVGSGDVTMQGASGYFAIETTNPYLCGTKGPSSIVNSTQLFVRNIAAVRSSNECYKTSTSVVDYEISFIIGTTTPALDCTNAANAAAGTCNHIKITFPSEFPHFTNVLKGRGIDIRGGPNNQIIDIDGAEGWRGVPKDNTGNTGYIAYIIKGVEALVPGRYKLKFSRRNPLLPGPTGTLQIDFVAAYVALPLLTFDSGMSFKTECSVPCTECSVPECDCAIKGSLVTSSSRTCCGFTSSGLEDGENVDYTFTLPIGMPARPNDICHSIEINFPAQYADFAGTEMFQLSSGGTQFTPRLNIDSANQKKMTISGLRLNGDEAVVFTLFGIKNPASPGSVGDFNVKIFDCDNDLVEQATVSLPTAFANVNFDTCLILDVEFVVENAYELSWNLAPTSPVTGNSYKRLETMYDTQGWAKSTHRFCVDETEYTITADLGLSTRTWGTSNTVKISCQGNIVAGPYTASAATFSEAFNPATLCSPENILIYASDTTTAGVQEIKNILAVQGDFRPTLKVPSTLFDDATKSLSCTVDMAPLDGYLSIASSTDSEALCRDLCLASWLNGCRAFIYNSASKSCRLHPRIAALTSTSSGTNFCRIYLEPNFSSTKLVVLLSSVPHGFGALLKHLPIPVVAMNEAAQIELGIGHRAVEMTLSASNVASIAASFLELPPGLYPGNAHLSTPMSSDLISTTSSVTPVWIGSVPSSESALKSLTGMQGVYPLVAFYRCQAAFNAGRRIGFGMPESMATEMGEASILAMGQSIRWALADSEAAKLANAQNLLTFSVEHYRPSCASTVTKAACWGNIVSGTKAATIDVTSTSTFLGTVLNQRFATEYRARIWIEKEEWRGFQIKTGGTGTVVSLYLDSVQVLSLSSPTVSKATTIKLTQGWHELFLSHAQAAVQYSLALETRDKGLPIWSTFDLSKWNTPFVGDVETDCLRATAVAQAVPAEATRTSLHVSTLLAAKSSNSIISQGVSLTHPTRRLAAVLSTDILSTRSEYETTVPVDENFERHKECSCDTDSVTISVSECLSNSHTSDNLIPGSVIGDTCQLLNKKITSGLGEISFGTQGNAYWILSSYHMARKTQTMYRREDLLAFDPPMKTGDIIKKISLRVGNSFQSVPQILENFRISYAWVDQTPAGMYIQAKCYFATVKKIYGPKTYGNTEFIMNEWYTFVFDETLEPWDGEKALIFEFSHDGTVGTNTGTNADQYRKGGIYKWIAPEFLSGTFVPSSTLNIADNADTNSAIGCGVYPFCGLNYYDGSTSACATNSNTKCEHKCAESCVTYEPEYVTNTFSSNYGNVIVGKLAWQPDTTCAANSDVIGSACKPSFCSYDPTTTQSYDARGAAQPAIRIIKQGAIIAVRYKAICNEDTKNALILDFKESKYNLLSGAEIFHATSGFRSGHTSTQIYNTSTDLTAQNALVVKGFDIVEATATPLTFTLHGIPTPKQSIYESSSGKAPGFDIRLCNNDGNEVASATTGTVTFPGELSANVEWSSSTRKESKNLLVKVTPSFTFKPTEHDNQLVLDLGSIDPNQLSAVSVSAGNPVKSAGVVPSITHHRVEYEYGNIFDDHDWDAFDPGDGITRKFYKVFTQSIIPLDGVTGNPDKRNTVGGSGAYSLTGGSLGVSNCAPSVAWFRNEIRQGGTHYSEVMVEVAIAGKVISRAVGNVADFSGTTGLFEKDLGHTCLNNMKIVHDSTGPVNGATTFNAQLNYGTTSGTCTSVAGATANSYSTSLATGDHHAHISLMTSPSAPSVCDKTWASLSEVTLDITAQAITENVGVTVSQNEWTLAITSQTINEDVGVSVTQGTSIGTLKTALTGDSTSVVISVASGVTFVSGVQVEIGSTPVVLSNVITAMKATGTLKTTLQNEWTLGITDQSITEDAGVTVTQGSVTGTLKTALQNEWTLEITEQTITEDAGVTVTQGSVTGTLKTALQNEWTLDIEEQTITKDVGVAVTQGSATGTLKIALAGATTSVVIQTASGVEFSASSNIVIGSTTVVLDRVTSATNSLTTSSLVIQTLKGVTFVASADVMVGSTALAFGNVASSTQTKVATTIPANNIGAATKLISYANYTFCDDCDGNGGISCDCIAGTALDQNSNNICIWLGGVIDNVRAPPNRVTRTLQIIVTNVNEPPVLNFTQVSLTVMENSPGGTPLGKVSAKDPDNVNVANPQNLQSLSFFITTDLAATSYPTAAQADSQTQLSCYNQVCIHRETGLLSVNGNGPPLDYEANQDGNFVFYVRAEDNGGNCLGTVPDLGDCYIGK